MDLNKILKELNLRLLEYRNEGAEILYYVVTKKSARVTMYPATKTWIESIFTETINRITENPSFIHAEVRKPHLFKQSILIKAGLINIDPVDPVDPVAKKKSKTSKKNKTDEKTNEKKIP